MKDEKRDEIGTAGLFQEIREKPEDFLITELCKYFLQLRQICHERACIALLKVFKYNFSVLKQLILE